LQVKEQGLRETEYRCWSVNIKTAFVDGYDSLY